MAATNIPSLCALWLVTLALIASSILADHQPRCPSAMPYAGCVCIEDVFQVRCNTSANFTEGLPDRFPDANIIDIKGVNMEVLASIPYSNLQSLSLRENNIRIIRDGVFGELGNLATLVLSDNPIGEIHLETFLGLESVTFIVMENSRIYTIPSFTFVGKHLRQLEILRLSNARLYDIEDHAFHMLHRLKLLNISYNFLRYIPDFASTDSLLNLTTLDLSHNQIMSMHRELFEYLPRLQFLLLNNNRIGEIDTHAFFGLDSTIVSIDLSFNVINASAATAFIALRRLQSLYLNDNALTGLVWEELPWDNLINLVIHDNPWDCACHNSWLVESELIAVHNNNSHFLCGSPKAIKDTPVLLAPESAFSCPRRSPHPHTALLLGLAGVVSVVAAGVGALWLYRCLRRRGRGLAGAGLGGGGAGGATPTSAYKRVHDDQGELILRT